MSYQMFENYFGHMEEIHFNVELTKQTSLWKTLLKKAAQTKIWPHDVKCFFTVIKRWPFHSGTLFLWHSLPSLCSYRCCFFFPLFLKSSFLKIWFIFIIYFWFVAFSPPLGFVTVCAGGGIMLFKWFAVSSFQYSNEQSIAVVVAVVVVGLETFKEVN